MRGSGNPGGQYSITRIILLSLIRTSQIIHTIVIHSIIYFHNDCIDFDVWIIRTFWIIRVPLYGLYGICRPTLSKTEEWKSVYELFLQ